MEVQSSNQKYVQATQESPDQKENRNKLQLDKYDTSVDHLRKIVAKGTKKVNIESDQHITNPDNANRNTQISKQRVPSDLEHQLECQNDNQVSEIQLSSQFEQNIQPSPTNIQIVQMSHKSAYQRIKESLHYFFSVHRIYFFEYIAAIITIHLIMVLQYHLVTNAECVPKLRYEMRQKDEQLKECPVDQQSLLYINYIIFFTTTYGSGMLMITNLQQLKYRFIPVLLFMIYVYYELWILLKDNKNKYTANSFYLKALIYTTVSFILRQISKHKLVIHLYKQVIFLSYMLLMAILITSIVELENNDSFLFQFMFQQVPSLFRRLSYYNLKKRIEMQLFHDDMQIVICLTYMYDYIILQRFLLVSNSDPFQQIILIISFVIIQVQNNLGINVIYEIYKYCFKNRILLLLNLTLVKNCLQAFIDCGSSIFNKLYSCSVIILIRLIFEQLSKAIQNDNKEAIDLLNKNIDRNGFLKIKITPEEIEEYFSQCCVFSYGVYLLSQIIKASVDVFYTNKQSDFNNYFFINQYEQSQYPRMTASNIILVNIFIMTLNGILVYNKCLKGRRIIKQADKTHWFIFRVQVILAYLAAVDNFVFNHKYTRIKIEF